MIKLEPQLEAENKSIVTADWAAKFPEFSVYKPMHLLRRAGPLVYGIVLDRTSGNDQYRPAFHVHCLARPAHPIILSLNQPLLTRRYSVQESIKVRFHYDHVDEAAARFRNQITFPLVGDLSIAQIVESYERYWNSSKTKFPVHEFEDVVYYYTWCGLKADAERTLTCYVDRMSSWDPAVMERFGGLAAWRERFLGTIADPDQVRSNVESEVVRLKMSKIRDEGLRCCP